MTDHPPTPPGSSSYSPSTATRMENSLPAFEPREMRDEGTAIRTAKDLAHRHVGAIAWSRSADLLLGGFGAPVVVLQAGDVPQME